MLRRNLAQASSWRSRPICVFCATRAQFQSSQTRSLRATDPLLGRTSKRVSAVKIRRIGASRIPKNGESGGNADVGSAEKEERSVAKHGKRGDPHEEKEKELHDNKFGKEGKAGTKTKAPSSTLETPKKKREGPSKTLKEALTGGQSLQDAIGLRRKRGEQLPIQILNTEDLKFEAVEVDIPPVPKLAYELDRVLFNPGVYRLQDPRSRIYNFDPYLEKIMPVNEFDFDALSEYKTSSKDQELLDLTRRLGTKFTGSTSSMSSILQHFHYLLSNFRELNHDMLSRGFPEPSKKFSNITLGPSAVFLRYKDGVYAIDADKTHDGPNVMSWLGHSLEKLLTTHRSEFETYRRSSPEEAPKEDNASRCYHYSKQGNVLMRSQLDAQDPRLPGTGVFDLKTRAVVSIRMNHKEYEKGQGYQLRYDQGEWESYEREFYDMTRATMLKYSLQVRMGRMDGIFLAFHNIERIFGFQYLSLGDLDRVLHGQDDTTLGDHEFKLSIGLLDDLLSRAIKQFPETSIRLHVETRPGKTPFMYIFAEPVTEEQADEIQSTGEAAQKEFARRVVGIGKDNPEVQEAWQNVQGEVDEQVDVDNKDPTDQTADVKVEGTEDVDSDNIATTGEDGPATEKPKGPLMGWTLTVRNKVNDSYVNTPRDISKDDNWLVEYHVQEIPEDSRWRLYDMVKERRSKLMFPVNEEPEPRLKKYRESIQRISNRGRQWRNEQDKIDEELGVKVYKPMGPGSEASGNGEVTKKEARPEAVQMEETKVEDAGKEEAVDKPAEKKKSWFGL